MIQADQFIAAGQAKGFGFYAGVPCSFLTALINGVIGDPSLRYVGAVNEGDAVAIAAGAWLAGRKTVVMCQNSGLGNAVNPLTSLNFPFRIPTLFVTTWRGQPGLKDEPQHELMGRITGGLLDEMGIPWRPFPKETAAIAAAVAEADAAMVESRLPFAFVMEKDSVADTDLDEPQRPPLPPGRYIDARRGGERPMRIAALERLLAVVPDNAGVIATTGKSGRELFTLADRPQHLYQVGSMGCASSMGLGVALNGDRPIVVIDGDGALLMRMGALATIGAYAPRTLTHIVLDNGVHDSTGGQATVSAGVDFAKAALACGYRSGTVADDVAGFEAAIANATQNTGPHLVHLRIRPGSLEKLGRPTVSPREVADRFRDFLASDTSRR